MLPAKYEMPAFYRMPDIFRQRSTENTRNPTGMQSRKYRCCKQRYKEEKKNRNNNTLMGQKIDWKVSLQEVFEIMIRIHLAGLTAALHGIPYVLEDHSSSQQQQWRLCIPMFHVVSVPPTHPAGENRGSGPAMEVSENDVGSLEQLLLYADEHYLAGKLPLGHHLGKTLHGVELS
ncbi:hypothetical protein TNCV_3951541 [Trichonephila clavipes]|nr:hypothetical protein TNCV_3951541 [Trichonephila clavipes]